MALEGVVRYTLNKGRNAFFIKLKYFMAITYALCKENSKTGIDRMSIDILLGKVTLVGNQLTPLWRSQRFIVQHRRQAYC